MILQMIADRGAGSGRMLWPSGPAGHSPASSLGRSEG